MRPEDVGLVRSSLVMGKHSGRHAFKKKLAELGYELGDNALDEAFARFKALADKKKEIFDEDLIALVDDEIQADRPAHQGASTCRCTAAPGRSSPARIVLEIDGDAARAPRPRATGRSTPPSTRSSSWCRTRRGSPCSRSTR